MTLAIAPRAQARLQDRLLPDGVPIAREQALAMLRRELGGV